MVLWLLFDQDMVGCSDVDGYVSSKIQTEPISGLKRRYDHQKRSQVRAYEQSAWAVSSKQKLSQLLFESNEERGRPPVWSHRSFQCRCIGIALHACLNCLWLSSIIPNNFLINRSKDISDMLYNFKYQLVLVQFISLFILCLCVCILWFLIFF